MDLPEKVFHSWAWGAICTIALPYYTLPVNASILYNEITGHTIHPKRHPTKIVRPTKIFRPTKTVHTPFFENFTDHFASLSPRRDKKEKRPEFLCEKGSTTHTASHSLCGASPSRREKDNMKQQHAHDRRNSENKKNERRRRGSSILSESPHVQVPQDAIFAWLGDTAHYLSIVSGLILIHSLVTGTTSVEENHHAKWMDEAWNQHGGCLAHKDRPYLSTYVHNIIYRQQRKKRRGLP